jgi:preprotein translocase subunit SecD
VRSREVYWLILILLTGGLAAWIVFAPDDQFLGRDVSTRLGLDLQGGTQVLLKAPDPNVDPELMRTAAGVIDRRVNGLGVSEAIVQQSGNDRVIVELPGVENPEQAIETLRGTGQLEFIDPQGQFIPPGTVVRTSGNPEPAALATPITDTAGVTSAATLTDTANNPFANMVFQAITQGKDLDTAQVQLTISQGSIGSEPAVAFRWLNESATQLAQFSAQNVGRPMCIVLDNVVESCPTINNALTGGEGIITTSSQEDAQRIFNQLKYGALPVPLQVETSRTVTATLGENSVEASIVAGAVGLGVVALFMLLFYRLPGLLAVMALLIYTLITFAFYRFIPITLTLAGIAGFILSIGLAVDANVLIFARLKEELRRGRSLRVAVEQAFDEAWPAIRDSNVSTLITSTILYLFGNSFGVSIIKGFALTLGLGILVSMFTAIIVTRTLLRLMVDFNITNPWLYGLDRTTDTAQTEGPVVQPR